MKWRTVLTETTREDKAMRKIARILFLMSRLFKVDYANICVITDEDGTVINLRGTCKGNVVADSYTILKRKDK